MAPDLKCKIESPDDRLWEANEDRMTSVLHNGTWRKMVEKDGPAAGAGIAVPRIFAWKALLGISRTAMK